MKKTIHVLTFCAEMEPERLVVFVGADLVHCDWIAAQSKLEIIRETSRNILRLIRVSFTCLREIIDECRALILPR